MEEAARPPASKTARQSCTVAFVNSAPPDSAHHRSKAVERLFISPFGVRGRHTVENQVLNPFPDVFVSRAHERSGPGWRRGFDHAAPGNCS
jgi:hypothetical protein